MTPLDKRIEQEAKKRAKMFGYKKPAKRPPSDPLDEVLFIILVAICMLGSALTFLS